MARVCVTFDNPGTCLHGLSPCNISSEQWTPRDQVETSSGTGSLTANMLKEIAPTGVMSSIGSGEEEAEESAKKRTIWTELEVYGNSKNLSPKLWTLTHLTGLYLSENGIQRLPPEISRLKNLVKLDLSKNKLRSLPIELGDMTELRDLNLAYNSLRALPNEIGRLFQLKTLGLQGNPLPNEILGLASEVNGVSKLLMFMLDNLTGQFSFRYVQFEGLH